MERKLESLGALAGSTSSIAVGQIGTDLFRLSAALKRRLMEIHFARSTAKPLK